MNMSRLTTATAAAAVVVLAGSAVAVAAGDPTPTPPPRIAFVARGDGTNFADALAVGSVAGQLGAPVFTTPATSLSSATAAALSDYQPELVILTGGTAAISADVEAAIEQATGLPDGKVVRAAGANRYETAAQIAGLFEELGSDPAYLPTGATATDADLLDGKDSTAFQRAGNYQPAGEYTSFPMQLGGTSIGLNADAAEAEFERNRVGDVILPHDSGGFPLQIQLLVELDMPPVPPGGSVVLTEVTLCYELEQGGANDFIYFVEVWNMGERVAQADVELDSGQPVCEVVELGGSIAGGQPRLGVWYSSLDGGVGHELFFYGAQAVWELGG